MINPPNQISIAMHRLGRWAGALLIALTAAGCATTANAYPPMPGSYGGTGGARPLALAINPSSQTASRVGAGPITRGVSYSPSGGAGGYTYTTTATPPGLTITGGTTASPSFLATLTAGQDTVYTITGTVTDAAHATKPTNATIEFISNASPPPGLSLVMTPATQTQSRTGSGPISAGVTYTPSGGNGVYTYSTSAPGLTVTGGTTTTPTLSTTLTNGQDTVYNVTGTLTDSIGDTPATAPGTVEFISTATPPSLQVALSPSTASVSYSTSGAKTTNSITATASGGTGPYAYAWAYVSGDATPIADFPASAATTWSGTVTPTTVWHASWKVTVTDAVSATASATAAVNFTPTSTFPLDILARGMVADDVAQTLIWNPAGNAPNYTPTPKVGVGYCTVNVLGACTASPDFDNMIAAKITYIRIPIDVQQILTGIPFPNSYLQPVKATAVSYDAATGLVTVTVGNALNLGPTATTATANFTATKTITVASTAGLISGGQITDSTTPGAIPVKPATTIDTIVGNTVTLSANVTGMLSGDVLTSPALNFAGAACAVNPTASANYSGVTVIGVSSAAGIAVGAKISDLTTTGAIPAGTAVSSISGTTLTLSAKVTGVLLGDTLSIASNTFCPDLAKLNVSAPAAPGTGGSTVIYKIAPGLGLTGISTLNLANVWQPLPSTYTRTPNSSGCAATYASTTCTTNWTWAYLDTVIAMAISKGLAVDVVPFVAGVIPQDSQLYSGSSDGSTSGDLHEDMGLSQNCYGYTAPAAQTTCYEGMLQAANLALLNRYAALYPSASQIFWELYNEPAYLPPNANRPSWQDPLLWNKGIVSITNAIRGCGGGQACDTTHWIISDCISSAKAQNCQYLIPTGDTQTVYSFHKYDPAATFTQGSNQSVNPLLLYPREGTGEPAIGRPNGGIAPQYLPSPAPQYNLPSWQTTVDATTSGCKIGAGPVWIAAPAQLTGSGQKVACVKSGGGATSLVDFYTPATPGQNLEITKSDLLNNSVDGINLVTTWAGTTLPSPGGHDVATNGAPAVLKIIAGEIGVTDEVDYRSRLQYSIDIRSVLENTGVPGGQTSIPWDWWAFTGASFGVRPKGGGDTVQGHNCLGSVGGVAGYDLDSWAIISTPQVLTGVPYCTATPARPDFGTPGLP